MAVLPRPLVRAAIHRFWKYQEPELRQLDDYLDHARTAVDVGAWWGPWTASLAARCPQVHSFEPQPQLASQLRSWVPPHVVVHENAVSDSDTELVLSRPDARPGTDGLATLRTGGGPDQVQVQVRTIDGCDLDNVGFIKIDVEGFELAALRGAEQTLLRDWPRLMIEIEQRHLDCPIDEVFDWLHLRSYRGWFLRGNSWATLDQFDVAADQTAHLKNPKHRDYINAFLFVAESDGWTP